MCKGNEPATTGGCSWPLWPGCLWDQGLTPTSASQTLECKGPQAGEAAGTWSGGSGFALSSGSRPGAQSCSVLGSPGGDVKLTHSMLGYTGVGHERWECAAVTLVSARPEDRGPGKCSRGGVLAQGRAGPCGRTTARSSSGAPDPGSPSFPLQTWRSFFQCVRPSP